MPEDPDRLEREINEILNKIERFPAPDQRRKRAARRALRRFGSSIAQRQQAVARELSRISLPQLILLSFVLILASLFFPVIRGWLLIAGAAIFIASFTLLMFGGGRKRSPSSQQWRGRTLHYERESLAGRLRRWFRERRA